MPITATRVGASILIATEPNKYLISKSGWFSDAELSVGISCDLQVKNNGCGKGFVWVETNSLTIFGVYISPNTNIKQFSEQIEALRKAVSAAKGKCLIMGDFNAKHISWGSKRSDNRGRCIMDWTAAEMLCILNDGDKPTFRRGNQVSWIDLTIATASLATVLQGWKVRDDIPSHSDHELIEVSVSSCVEENQPIRRSLRYNAEKAHAFEADLHEVEFDAQQPERILEDIQGAARDHFLLRRNLRKKAAPWWSEDVAAARKKCHQARRKYLREAKKHGPTTATLKEVYREAREHLSRIIKEAKEASFKRLLREANQDPWGDAYKIVKRKYETLPSISVDTQLRLARELFPRCGKTVWINRPARSSPPFTRVELEAAIQRIKPGKAPGPDGLTGDIVKAIYRAIPDKLLVAMNHYLANGIFPQQWKKAELRLLPKPMKAGQLTKKYRPICLISILGKVLEYMVSRRLSGAADDWLAPNQHGFRQNRSTVNAIRDVIDAAVVAKENGEDTIIIMTFDVKNAFNTARWDRIIEVLTEKQVPDYLINMVQSYFTDRTIHVGPQDIPLECGVPQGSVLGPLLWNVFYNDVALVLPPKSKLVAYADDLALVTWGSGVDTTLLYAELGALMITTAIEQLRIELAPEKTEAAFLYAPRHAIKHTVPVLGHKIPVMNDINYLGVTLERGLRVRKHIDVAARKADQQIHCLQRLLKVNSPIEQHVRKLYAGVIMSRIMYAAPAWLRLVQGNTEHEKLTTASRAALLRVCAGVPSVSVAAAEVISGMPPILLRLQELSAVFSGKNRSTARSDTLRTWQEHWESPAAEKGRWTRRLIPNIRAWLDRKHGTVDRYLCQFLSGHGEFRWHQSRMGTEVDPNCSTCGVPDTAEHAFFECDSSAAERGTLKQRTGIDFQVGSVVQDMVSKESTWDAVKEFVHATVVAREARREGLQTLRD